MFGRAKRPSVGLLPKLRGKKPIVIKHFKEIFEVVCKRYLAARVRYCKSKSQDRALRGNIISISLINKNTKQQLPINASMFFHD